MNKGRGHNIKYTPFAFPELGEGDTYDTLTFASGALLVSVPGVVLYQAAAANTTGGTAAAATVTDDIDDTLTVSIPAGSTPANFNGLRVTIAQAGDDNLSVSFKSGILKISPANTTAGKNNAALIQAAIRALGRVGVGLDFNYAAATGSPGWDDAQSGAVLTNSTAVFAAGVNIGTVAYKYEPERLLDRCILVFGSDGSVGIVNSVDGFLFFAILRSLFYIPRVEQDIDRSNRGIVEVDGVGFSKEHSLIIIG